MSYKPFILLIVVGSLAAVAFGSPAVDAVPQPAQNKVETANATPVSEPSAYVLRDSEVRSLSSATLDRSYKLQIKLPPGYSAAENAGHRYPVIYFNDATYTWLTAVGVTIFPFHTQVYEKAILVGLSHAEGEKSQLSRTRDYTPTDSPRTRYPSGGAKQYLAFLKDEVLPFIETNYRADPERRILSGVSYGGLFGAYALLEEPGLFQDYILTSPSLWHNARVMFELEKAAFASGKNLTGRVYFATGEAEIPERSPGFPNMVGDQKDFAARLRSRGYAGLQVRDEIVEDGTHLTTYPIGLTRALRWMLPGEKPYSD